MRKVLTQAENACTMVAAKEKRMTTERSAWYEAMKAKGHMPYMVDYGDGDEQMDIFVVDSGFHNGPGCQVCPRMP